KTKQEIAIDLRCPHYRGKITLLRQTVKAPDIRKPEHRLKIIQKQFILKSQSLRTETFNIYISNYRIIAGKVTGCDLVVKAVVKSSQCRIYPEPAFLKVFPGEVSIKAMGEFGLQVLIALDGMTCIKEVEIQFPEGGCTESPGISRTLIQTPAQS